MVHWRTILRIFIETAGEFAIIFAAISLDRVLRSKESSKWKKIICILILLLLGVVARIYGDDFTIAVHEGNLWEKLFRLTN